MMRAGRRCGSRFWALAAGVCLATTASAARVTSVRLLTDVVELGFQAVPGTTYNVQSAPSPEGAWTPVQTLRAEVAQVTWSSPAPPPAGSHFYRVREVVEPVGGLVKSQINAVEAVPLDIANRSREMRDLAASAVSLASALSGAGLVTNGILTQVGAAWNYSPGAADRLDVRFQNGSNAIVRVARIEGDFSGDAARFLARGHRFEFRLEAPNGHDLAMVSEQPDTGCDFRGTLRGTLPVEGRVATVDLAASGSYCTETDTGFASLLTDTRLTGLVLTEGFRLVVNQRRRFELISNQGQSATSEQVWLDSTLETGGSTYVWNQVKRQKSFSNGVPSDVDGYWLARGEILRDGRAYGTYLLDTRTSAAFIYFQVALPGGTIELESWKTF